MFRLRLCVLSLFVVCSAAHASARTDLLAHLNAIKSFQANFTQARFVGGQKQVNTGKVWIQKPEKFKWQVLTPNKQLLISNGVTLYQVDPLLHQAIKHQVKTLGATPMQLLSGQAVKVLSGFNVIFKKGVYGLIPKTKQSVIQGMALSFKNQQLAVLDFKNALGQTTVIHFNDVKQNQPIAPSTFVFHAPKGMLIVE
jgi:outer membrane lipoprotein carrier protein